MMWKACPKCGKIHPFDYKCTVGREWNQYKTDEDKLHNTYQWKKKAKEIKERSMYLCAVCAEEFKKDNSVNLNADELEVHHIEKVREHPELLLDDSNLICLCPEHHREAEKGNIKKEYLKKLIMQRDV